MKTHFVPIALLLSLSLLSALPIVRAGEPSEKTPAATAPASPQTAHTVERDVKVRLQYLLYLPKDYDKKEAWPLVLFLHGAGERGDNLDLVKKHGPPKLIEEGKSFPFLVVSPQCPENKWWEPVALTALLDEIVAKYKIDKDRVYVTGLSMGGFGTWSLAAHTPKRFAAIVPICGGGEAVAAQVSAARAHLGLPRGEGPGRAAGPSEAMVDALKQAGGNVKFTIYPNAGHDAWTETYANPKLYEWLLEQKRSGDEKKEK